MRSLQVIRRLTILLLIFKVYGASAEHILDPKASYVDVRRRHHELTDTRDARTKQAIADLSSCSKLPTVLPPSGRMVIPRHYLVGIHGDVYPEEAKATVVYHDFERRVTTGMNQWLVSAKREEAQCAQDQIDLWAKADALLDYDPHQGSQAWYQVEWTLSAISISESVIINEASLDQVQTRRDIQWMNRVAHRSIGFDESMHQDKNNHHYWRALIAVSTGILSSDESLFHWGIDVYKSAIDDIDQRGALPKEMARSERALHYQDFALQPLTALAAFAERQKIYLYSYKSPSGRSLVDAANFLGEALLTPQILKSYAQEEQIYDVHDPSFFAFAELLSHHIPTGTMPTAIADGLKRPTYATRIGGSLTVVDGYIPEAKKNGRTEPR